LHSIQTPWSIYLSALTAPSHSRDPLTDVCWAIPELDAIRFTALEKADGVSIHEGQLEKVQYDTVPLAFRREERCQIADVLYVHTTAQLKNDLAVLFPGDPEHLSLLASPHATPIAGIFGNSESNSKRLILWRLA